MMNKLDCCSWKNDRVKLVLREGLLIEASELSQVMTQKAMFNLNLHGFSGKAKKNWSTANPMDHDLSF